MGTAEVSQNKGDVLDKALAGYAGLVLLVAISVMLLLVTDAWWTRGIGWVLSVLALVGSVVMLLNAVRDRKGRGVGGATPDVTIPSVIGVGAALLVLAHSWGWATWLST
jgi:hypothetical protein